MSLYNILNSVDLTLEKNIKTYNDSFVDNFIDELKNYLFKSDSMQKLSQMPKDTIFEVNEIEKDYIQCYLNHKEFSIPKDKVCLSELKTSDIGFIRIAIKR